MLVFVLFLYSLIVQTKEDWLKWSYLLNGAGRTDDIFPSLSLKR